MIRKIENNISFTVAEKRIIRSIGNMDSKSWNKAELSLIRDKIKNQLINVQRNTIYPTRFDFIECAYCGLIMGGTGRKEVEHIAHKGKHPEFSYHPENLIYTCSHCNGSSKKGQKEVVETKHQIEINSESNTYFEDIEEAYLQTKFKILHPKRDNPDNYYLWKDETKIILLDGLTTEAKNSIKMFDLKSFHMTQEREKQSNDEIRYIENPERFEEIWNATK